MIIFPNISVNCTKTLLLLKDSIVIKLAVGLGNILNLSLLLSITEEGGGPNINYLILFIYNK